MWIEEIAVAWPRVSFRSGATAALQDKLARHEFAVVLPDGACGCAKPGIGEESRAGPLPDLAKELTD